MAALSPQDYSVASYDMTKPNPPLEPPTYSGLRTVQYTSPADTTVAADRFWVDGKQGGWGAYTMGLLDPSALMGKSYGLFGSGTKTASTGPTAAITAYGANAAGVSGLGPSPAYPYVPAYYPVAYGYVNDAT